MKYKIVIVDDHPSEAARVEQEIQRQLSNRIESCLVFNDSGNPLILQAQADLYILDMEMPKMNGIDLFKQLEKTQREFMCFFVSGHEELVFRSYHVNAFFFVRKNVLKEDMAEAIAKFETLIAKRDKSWVMKDGTHIRLTEILYFEKEKNNLIIYTLHGNFTERKAMKGLLQIESELGFCRCHVAYIVNFKHVAMMKDNELIMKNKQKVPISRSYKNAVREAYLNYEMRLK